MGMLLSSGPLSICKTRRFRIIGAGAVLIAYVHISKLIVAAGKGCSASFRSLMTCFLNESKHRSSNSVGASVKRLTKTPTITEITNPINDNHKYETVYRCSIPSTIGVTLSFFVRFIWLAVVKLALHVVVE